MLWEEKNAEVKRAWQTVKLHPGKPPGILVKIYIRYNYEMAIKQQRKPPSASKSQL